MKIHSKEQVTLDKKLVARLQAYIDRTGEHKNAVIRKALEWFLTEREGTHENDMPI